MVTVTSYTRSYYSKNLRQFLDDDNNNILGDLAKHHQFNLEEQQKNAWISEIEILKNQLRNFDTGHILFEYTIPRMGRRVDNILLYKGCVYLLEFKIGSESYKNADLRQVEGYAVDLKNFQEGSRNCKLIPILISTSAPKYENKVELYEDNIIWENSGFNPTPTIIEASQALYNNHDVEEISRKDSIGTAFRQTSESIDRIISKSKKELRKSIIFVTGVPGSGKTLVGLNIASKYQDTKNNERAVYISGTATLIAILQEALVRDKVAKSPKLTKTKVKKDVETLFQYLLHYRKEVIEYPNQKPSEKIVVFDEAQRMWNQEQLDKEIRIKLGRSGTEKSEPDLLIGHMDKHEDWSVIICLIGGGQEIHKGEYGTIEWLKSIKTNFPHWDVYLPTMITDKDYLGSVTPIEALKGINHEFIDGLHLKTSARSFKAQDLSKFINHLLDKEIPEAKKIVNKLKEKYPLYVTRDIKTAKTWVKNKSRGNERFGLFTTALSHRLHPEGIVKRGPKEFNPQGWWLDSEEYVDSSLALEIPCTEFFSQGLEVDWAIFAWDACFIPNKLDWNYRRF